MFQRGQITLIYNPLLAICSKELSGGGRPTGPLSQGGQLNWHLDAEKSEDEFASPSTFADKLAQGSHLDLV